MWASTNTPQKTQTISIITLGGVYIEHEPQGTKNLAGQGHRTLFTSLPGEQNGTWHSITEAASYPAQTHRIPYVERHRVQVAEVTA
jgi:hypothetical protein